MDTVFYSWQSDSSKKTNRYFIEEALKRAARVIRNDDSIAVEPVVDRDTEGVPGSPDIAHTIFAKIDRASVFVCDVSFINPGAEARLTPNPNVLVELGYALRALTSERVVLVMNEEYGPIEKLPFDLKQRRVVAYRLSENQPDRADVRKALSQRLELALRKILESASAKASAAKKPVTPVERARGAITNSHPTQVLHVREYMAWIVEQLRGLVPNQELERPYDQLLASLAGTSELIVNFARLSEDIAVHGSERSAEAAFKGFEGIAALYGPPEGFGGTFFHYWFDAPRFVGHELFVTLVALLIREDRWELLADVLQGELRVPNSKLIYTAEGEGVVSWEYLSMGPLLLSERGGAPTNRISVHADLLHKRHSTDELGKVLPERQFIDADYFLFLRSVLPPAEDPTYAEWEPWSALYLKHVPGYLIDARKSRFAARFLTALGVDGAEQFRDRFKQRNKLLKQLFRGSPHFFPLHEYNPSDIARR